MNKLAQNGSIMRRLLTVSLVCLVAIVSIYLGLEVFVVTPTRDRIQAQEAQVLSKISIEYGVANDWRSARYAIYCIVFRTGKSVLDVESELTRLGKWTKAGSLDIKTYTLDGLNVGNERFRIHAVFVSGRVARLSVLENWDQSDSDAQPITCRNGTYTYTYVDLLTPEP